MGGETGGETDEQKTSPKNLHGSSTGLEKRMEKRLEKWLEKWWRNGWRNAVNAKCGNDVLESRSNYCLAVKYRFYLQQFKLVSCYLISASCLAEFKRNGETDGQFWGIIFLSSGSSLGLALHSSPTVEFWWRNGGRNGLKSKRFFWRKCDGKVDGETGRVFLPCLV